MPRGSDIEVDVPGVGTVYFPPEMSMAAIRAKASELSQLGLRHQHNRNVEAEAQVQPVEFMGLRPSEIGEGVRALGMFGGVPGAVLGEEAAQAIEQAGGTRQGFDPVAIGAQAAIPAAVRGVGELARPVAKGMYASALKLSTALKPAKRASILETGLNEGRIPTEGSLRKSIKSQKALEDEVEARIATDPNAPLDTQAIASRVDQISPRFETVNPLEDAKALRKSKREFLKSYPTLTTSEGQEIKKKTYKVLGDRAYGEQKTAAKEAEKALARGIKEELELKFPELKELNAKEGALIDLNKALGKAISRVENRDIMGIGVPIKTAAFGPGGFLAGLMDAPGVKSRLAIAIDKARHLKKLKLGPVQGELPKPSFTRTATLPTMYEEDSQ